jgi:predicted RNase H-like nuclease/ppGpp synthetase/RelA/SpoT-type nucleotidyltranferase
MFFMGLDLAWGNSSPTGVAVLDGAGVLQHLSAVTTDAEIAAALAPYLADGCLVGVDAPLIVKNEKGSRPAEKALNRDFARFDAGAHPSNTSNPALSETTRGARVCARLGLDMNPESRAAKRAVEVYPHPATVALFRLGRTLKYKNKQGRSVDQLRAELLVLMRLLESLASAKPALQLVSHDGWRELVAAVEKASRKAELRRAEDQVDAVICAYVALFRERRPEAVTTYGDFESGFIVTPTLPADLVPSPRAPRVEKHVDIVRRATQEYATLHRQLVVAAEEAVEVVTGILDDAGLNYLDVTGRAKSIASFAEKAGRTANGVVLYGDPLADIGDVIGLRVITYVHSDVASVAELLGTEAVVLSDRDMGQETAKGGSFGYVSRHLQIQLSDEDRLGHPAIGDRQIQVQIRTVLQHAWAEFEHDIRYKGVVPEEHRADFDRRFTLAAGLLELADREFSIIRERLQSGVPDVEESSGDDDPRISPRELAAFLAGQYDDASWSRPDHYAWIAGLVLELGITSLSELAEAIRGVDSTVIDQRMSYRNPTGAVRRLDDALLVAHGERYITLHGNAHRVDRLQARLKKMSTDPTSPTALSP